MKSFITPFMLCASVSISSLYSMCCESLRTVLTVENGIENHYTTEQNGMPQEFFIPFLQQNSIISLLYGLYTGGDEIFALSNCSLEEFKNLTIFNRLFTRNAIADLQKVLFLFMAPGIMVPFSSPQDVKDMLIQEGNKGWGITLPPDYQDLFNATCQKIEKKYAHIAPRCLLRLYFNQTVEEINQEKGFENPLFSLHLTPHKTSITLNQGEKKEIMILKELTLSQQLSNCLNNILPINSSPSSQLKTASRKGNISYRQHPYDGWRRRKVRERKEPVQ